jgi:hypothetical protein
MTSLLQTVYEVLCTLICLAYKESIGQQKTKALQLSVVPFVISISDLVKSSLVHKHYRGKKIRSAV